MDIAADKQQMEDQEKRKGGLVVVRTSCVIMTAYWETRRNKYSVVAWGNRLVEVSEKFIPTNFDSDSLSLHYCKVRTRLYLLITFVNMSYLTRD